MNPFDPKTILFAKHAQHVALIHFPIALFAVGVAFDFVAQNAKRAGFAMVAYYNFLVAAISTVPVIGTGILAWQLQLDGEKPKGVLRMHFIFGWASGILIALVWFWHFRSRKQEQPTRPVARLALELLAVGVVMLTGHLGGFVSGVNVPN
ncbi:MAG TPA: DUF2231 domain-containing protein [Candidatus Acidoferrum sp.]|nr:DUF2231 domain-containing protein [Candidatus Acidoferrum sp.]